jgi:hypothetical protein
MAGSLDPRGLQIYRGLLGKAMIRTTFEFLMVFAILIVVLHVLLVPRIKSRNFWRFAEWFAIVVIGVGFIIAVGEMRGLTQRRRLQDFDAFIQMRLSNARGRAEDMIAYCRKLVEMSGGSGSSASSEFHEAEQWAVAAAEALRTRYETDDWLRFLEKNSSVNTSEDPVIQQLKLPLLELLAEMKNGRTSMREQAKELNRRGQLLWLSPFSPWLLVIGLALRITKVSADWRMESVRTHES